MIHFGQRLSIAFTVILMALLAPLSFAQPAVTVKAAQASGAPAVHVTPAAGTDHAAHAAHVSTASTMSTAGTGAATLNINTASVEAIAEQLNGIGAAKAQAIVAYREANGPFASVEDLANVKGIGAATLEKNAALIVVE